MEGESGIVHKEEVWKGKRNFVGIGGHGDCFAIATPSRGKIFVLCLKSVGDKIRNLEDFEI